MESKTYTPVEKADEGNTLYYQQPRDVLLEKLKKHVRAMNWLVYNNGKDACYNCKEEGHFSSQCPNKKTMKCYNCKELGHFANKCPARQADDSNPKQPGDFIKSVLSTSSKENGFGIGYGLDAARSFKTEDVAEPKHSGKSFGFGSTSNIPGLSTFAVPLKTDAEIEAEIKAEAFQKANSSLPAANKFYRKVEHGAFVGFEPSVPQFKFTVASKPPVETDKQEIKKELKRRFVPKRKASSKSQEEPRQKQPKL